MNEQITGMLIAKFSELMKSLDAVKDNVLLENDLANNELLKRDLKRVIGMVTPYIPHVGLLSGGVTGWSVYVVEKRCSKKEEED